MSFIRDAAGVLVTNTVAIPLALATNVVLARFLSLEDRGLYALLVAFASLAAVVADLGWSAAIVHRILRMRIPPARAFTAGLAGSVAASAVVVLGCWLLRQPLSHHFLGDAPVATYWLAAWSVPTLLLGEFARGAARAVDRFDLANWYGFAQSAGLFLLLVPVLVLGEGRLLESMVVFLAVNALAAIWLLGWLVRTIGVSTTIDAGEARQGMRFGARSYLNHLTMRLHDQLDLFIVAYLLPQAEEVAYYAVAAGTVGRMVVLPTSMALAIYPRLAGAPDDEAARFSSFVTRHAVWLTTATLIIAAPLAAPLFTLLYGSDYRASVAPFWLLLPALPGLTASRLLGRWFLAADRQVPMIVARTLAIAINLIANLMLIPHFGIAGAAAAKSVSLLLEGCVVAFAFSAATGLQLRALLRLRGDDVAPYLRRWRAWRARLSASEPPGPGPSGH